MVSVDDCGRAAPAGPGSDPTPSTQRGPVVVEEPGEHGPLVVVEPGARSAHGGRATALPRCSSSACWRVFQERVAHLMRTGNFTTPRSASRSPSFTSGSLDRLGRSPSPSSSDCSWIDIIALKAWVRASDLVEGLALHRRRHHRGRRLADRAALAADADVGDHAVVDVEVDDDLVAAERVEALDPRGRRRLELAPVPRGAVVVEDDLSVEVFEAGHAGGDPTGGQRAKKSAAAARASASASTSCSSL